MKLSAVEEALDVARVGGVCFRWWSDEAVREYLGWHKERGQLLVVEGGFLVGWMVWVKDVLMPGFLERPFWWGEEESGMDGFVVGQVTCVRRGAMRELTEMAVRRWCWWRGLRVFAGRPAYAKASARDLCGKRKDRRLVEYEVGRLVRRLGGRWE